jgi:hypothetical protein
VLGRHFHDLREDRQRALARRRSASTCSPIAISGATSCASSALAACHRKLFSNLVQHLLQLRFGARLVRSATGWPWNIA